MKYLALSLLFIAGCPRPLSVHEIREPFAPRVDVASSNAVTLQQHDAGTGAARPDGGAQSDAAPDMRLSIEQVIADLRAYPLRFVADPTLSRLCELAAADPAIVIRSAQTNAQPCTPSGNLQPGRWMVTARQTSLAINVVMSSCVFGETLAQASGGIALRLRTRAARPLSFLTDIDLGGRVIRSRPLDPVRFAVDSSIALLHGFDADVDGVPELASTLFYTQGSDMRVEFGRLGSTPLDHWNFSSSLPSRFQYMIQHAMRVRAAQGTGSMDAVVINPRSPDEDGHPYVVPASLTPIVPVPGEAVLPRNLMDSPISLVYRNAMETVFAVGVPRRSPRGGLQILRFGPNFEMRTEGTTSGYPDDWGLCGTLLTAWPTSAESGRGAMLCFRDLSYRDFVVAFFEATRQGLQVTARSSWIRDIGTPIAVLPTLRSCNSTEPSITVLTLPGCQRIVSANAVDRRPLPGEMNLWELTPVGRPRLLLHHIIRGNYGAFVQLQRTQEGEQLLLIESNRNSHRSMLTALQFDDPSTARVLHPLWHREYPFSVIEPVATEAVSLEGNDGSCY